MSTSPPQRPEPPREAREGELSARPARGPDDPRPLLRQRNFLALLSGQLVAITGERLSYLALLGLLAEHTDQFKDPNSSWLLTLLMNVMLAPVLLFSPFTGAWVDRWNLKRTMIVSDAVRALLVVLIPFLYLATHHTLPVYTIVFLLFTANVFFLPSKSAITPEIVPGPQLLAANAWLAGAGIAATAIGALAGGEIVDALGWSTTLMINAVTYLVSVVALALIAYRPVKSAAASPEISLRGYLREVAEGWNIVRRNSTVVLGLIALGATWIGGSFLHVAGNLHIQRSASTPGMVRVGILMGVLGIGGILGTWWVNTHGRSWRRPTILAVGLFMVAIALGAFAVSTRFAYFAIAAFFIGMAAAPAFTLSETMLQQGTEVRQRGRVFSARDFIMRLLGLVAASAAGWWTQSLGVPNTILACAGLMAIAGGVMLWWQQRHGERDRPPA